MSFQKFNPPFKAVMAVFLLTTLLLAVAVVWVSFVDSRTAQALSLAGRQRALSQCLQLRLLQLQQGPLQPGDAHLADLAQTAELFELTLRGFAQGGMTRDLVGQPVALEPVTSALARAQVDQALMLWEPFVPLLRALQERPGQTPDVAAVARASAYAQANVPALFAHMDQLTQDFSQAHDAELTQLRTLLGALVALLLLASGWLWRQQRELLQALAQENRSLQQQSDSTRAELSEAQAQMHLLNQCVAKINDVVLITEAEPYDQPGPRILYVNDAFERMTGYSRAEALGNTPRMLQGAHTQRSELNRMRRAFERWESVRAEVINYTKSGREYWVEIEIAPVADASGWYTHWISVQRDITARKQAEAERLQLTQMANESSRLKTEFLRNITHELRTPMNGILGMSQLLASTPLDQKQMHYLHVLSESANSFLRIINGVLDFRNMDAGVLNIEKAAFDLPALLARCVAQQAAQAAAKHLALDYQLDPQVPTQLLGDERRVAQVLGYFLDNAVKFTAVGCVSLQVGLLAREADQLWLRFAVKDSGIGIGADQLALLFQPFVQVDGSISRRFGGTGLGLALAHKLVDLMHGKVDLQSEPGVGSTFWFDLPLAVAETRAL